MARRRPPPLAEVPKEDNRPGGEGKLQITDTMTLVIGNKDGTEQMRVKTDGIASEAQGDAPASAATTPQQAKPRVTSVFNSVHFEDLKIGEVIGEGSQGRVRRVMNRRTGELLALKSISFTDDKEATRQALHHELTRIRALKHPNVVSSFEAYFREGKLYILMELMDCGTTARLLKAHGRGIAEPIVAYISQQTLIGLAHLHSSNVVHRDIKPANLLVNSRGEVKISDFGVAGDSQKLYQTSVGSTPYMSPERVQSQPYTTLCDVWSVGVTMAELAIGHFPFGDVKGKAWELCQLIASGNAVPQWQLAGPQAQFSDLFKEFVGLCMQPAESRPTAEALLQHAFLRQEAGKYSPEEVGRWFANPV